MLASRRSARTGVLVGQGHGTGEVRRLLPSWLSPQSCHHRRHPAGHWVFPKASPVSTDEGDVVTFGTVTRLEENYRLPPGTGPTGGPCRCLPVGAGSVLPFLHGRSSVPSHAGILTRRGSHTVSAAATLARHQNLRHLCMTPELPDPTRQTTCGTTSAVAGSERFAPVLPRKTTSPTWQVHRRRGQPVGGALFVLLRNTVMSLGIVYACLVSPGGVRHTPTGHPRNGGSLVPAPCPSGEHRDVAPTIGTWAAIAVGFPLPWHY